MPRYVAERLGLVPVTITRCLSKVTGGFSNPHFLYAGDDLPKLFPPDRYFSGGREWSGGKVLNDNEGKKCLGFWPQTWRK
jgi:hypothetical protein